MNWLAKINFKVVLLQLGPYRSAGLLFTLIFICSFCGYRLGNFYHAYQENKISEQTSRLAQLYELQDQQVSLIHGLEVELEVERMANQRAQQQIKLMQDQQYEYKKSLAFYESVMAPEKKAGGLSVDSFSLYETKSPNHFRYQLILVQQNNKKRYVKGRVELSIAGSLSGTPHILDLAKLSQESPKHFIFSFKYFQVINGEFTLPEGFIGEQIEVLAIVDKKLKLKNSRLEQNYRWQEILKN